MNELKDTNPFSAPAANLEASACSPDPAPGWFWGGVFALPAVVGGAVLIWTLFIDVAKVDWSDRGLGLFLTIWAFTFALLLLGSGWGWARRFSRETWTSGLVFAVSCGAAHVVVALGGDAICRSLLPPKPGSGAISIGFLLAAVPFWLVMSLYVLLQGLLVRWTQRRRAAKRVREGG